MPVQFWLHGIIDFQNIRNKKMTGLPSYWKCRNNNKPDTGLLESSSFSPVLLEILAKRDIVGEEEIISFIKPSLKNLHDPMELPGIDEGIKRLIEAIESNENIIVFGDYDTDGIVSASIMFKFLKDLGMEVDVYIPDRFEEGYDLSVNFLKKVSSEGKCKLIIAVDCGTNSIEVQNFISENNSCPDIIVCDHHNQSVELDDVTGRYIIINPKLKNSRYKFKHLSGAAVTFKFINAVLKKLEYNRKKNFSKDYLTGLLDLISISTIADIMPLIGENRIIVKKGLDILQRTANPGLKKIIDLAVGQKDYIDEYDIGFIIAPRLNAAGRIKNARVSLDLLIEKGEILDKLANELNSFNIKRQKIQRDIFNEIVESNDFDEIVTSKKIFIDKSEDWNEGVLGIVASSIVKKFNIPAILFKEKEGKLKGSGRSIDKFDLYEKLVQLKDLFNSFGGHRLACGISMDIINYETFYKNLIKIADRNLEVEDIEKKFVYDVEINFKDINKMILNEINLLKPFGFGNPKPVFMSRNCVISDFSYLSGGKHVKLKLKQEGAAIDAIIFGLEEEIKRKIIKAKEINILYRIEENNWGNNKNIQLVISDLF